MSFIVLCLVSQLYSQRGEKCQVQNRLVFLNSLVSVFSSGAKYRAKILHGFPYRTQEVYAAFRSWATDNLGYKTVPMASTPLRAIPSLLFAF